MHRKLAWCVCI
jgi:hypothetical protein